MALNEEQVGKIRNLLASSGWNDVMKPVIATKAHNAIKALVLNPAERTGEYKDRDDASIRSDIKVLEWVLSCWQNEISVFEHNKRLEELDAQTNGA